MRDLVFMIDFGFINLAQCEEILVSEGFAVHYSGGIQVFWPPACPLCVVTLLSILAEARVKYKPFFCPLSSLSSYPLPARPQWGGPDPLCHGQAWPLGHGRPALAPGSRSP
jgi:hypothetical protein